MGPLPQTWPIIRSEQHYKELFATRQADLVYLTADSPHELGALNSQDVYIIGGIVDRNRYKLLTLKKVRKRPDSGRSGIPLWSNRPPCALPNGRR